MTSATSSVLAAHPVAEVENVLFTTGDGRTLTGRLYHPGTSPRLAVVLHGGAGFPARFYQDFASWLSAEHAAAVLTYDYRDFGWSLDRSLSRTECAKTRQLLLFAVTA